MSDSTKQMCPNFEMGRGYCLFPANHEGGCVFPKPANRSAKELADAIQSNPEEAIKILAEHDRALTAAVRREDAKIAGLCESWYEGKREEAAKYAGEEILALIKLQEQSALDAYRDSVLAPYAKKLRAILEHSVQHWSVKGNGIYNTAAESPLVKDRAAGAGSLQVIVDALNFSVRRLSLNKFCTELESALKGSSDAVPEREEPKP